MAIQSTEAPTLAATLDDAAIVTEALARALFGPAASLRRAIHENHETGEEQGVFEVHPCVPDPEAGFGRIAALHNTFMDAFAEATSPDILHRIIVKPVGSDAD